MRLKLDFRNTFSASEDCFDVTVSDLLLFKRHFCVNAAHREGSASIEVGQLLKQMLSLRRKEGKQLTSFTLTLSNVIIKAGDLHQAVRMNIRYKPAGKGKVLIQRGKFYTCYTRP